jgi:lysophospholipase L1-like esterase
MTAATVELFNGENQAATTVVSGGTTAPAAGTVENWTVASSALFPPASSSSSPPGQFHVADAVLALASEIIAVTNVSGTTWTVTRGAENSAPVAHSAGFTVNQVVTAGFLATVATTGTDGHLYSSITPRPTLYSPTGLRRWRAALGDSLFSQVPIVCVGDSITAGQGGDNNLSAFSNLPDNANGWAGQLRALLALRFGSYPGEGFWFADDSRVTWSGGTSNNNWPCVPLRHGPRIVHGSGNTVSLTVPAGVYVVGVIQANQTAAFNTGGSGLDDVSLLYSQTGSVTVSNASLTTLTNTGRAVTTNIAVQPGDTITLTAPATAQSYLAGFNMQTGQPGVLVHRIGQPGYVSGDLLGGQVSGTLNQASSSSNQTAAARACYDWAQTSWMGATGLVIAEFGANDQQFQAGGGASTQNDVTLSLYTTWMGQFIGQAITDGWSVLALASPRNPNGAGSGSTQDQYYATLLDYALGNDYAAYMDVGEWWGSNAAASALDLTAVTSVHPYRAGHGDIARTLFNAITGQPGITELTAA